MAIVNESRARNSRQVLSSLSSDDVSSSRITTAASRITYAPRALVRNPARVASGDFVSALLCCENFARRLHQTMFNAEHRVDGGFAIDNFPPEITPRTAAQFRFRRSLFRAANQTLLRAAVLIKLHVFARKIALHCARPEVFNRGDKDAVVLLT